MATSGTMKVNVVGDASKFNRTMDNVQGKLGKLGGAAKQFGKLAAVGVAGAGAAAVAAAGKLARFGDEVAESAQQAGLGTEQYQELKFAFDELGLSTPDKALQKFSRRIGEAADGSGAAVSSVEALGLELEKADGSMRDTGDVMDEAIDKLAGVESESRRAAIAGNLFGKRAGPELAAALGNGAEGIEEARQKAHDMGLVMGGDALDASQKFSSVMDDVKNRALGLLRQGLTPVLEFIVDNVVPFIENKLVPVFQSIFGVVAPLITILKDGLTPGLGDAHSAFKKIPEPLHGIAQVVFDVGSMIKQTVDIVGSFVTILKDGLTPGLGNAHEAFKTVPESLHGVGQAVFDVGSAIRQALTKISEWWSEHGPMIISTAKDIGKAIVNFARTSVKWVMKLAGGVDAAISTVVGWFESSGSQASETSSRMQSVFSQLLSTTKTVWNAISTVVGATIKAVSTVISATVAVIQAVWERWGSDIKQFAKTVFNAILTTIEGVLQTISGVFDVFAGLFTGDWERVWKGVKNIFAGLLSIIQGLWETALATVELGLQVFRDVMSSIWSRLWTWAKDFVSDRVDDVITFVTELPGRAKSGLSAAWSAYQEFWEEKFQAVTDFVSERVDDVIGFFRDLPGDIVDELGDLGSTLFQAGKDLLGGLAEGVKSAVGTLGDALSSAVSSAADAIPFVDASGDGPGFGVPDVAAAGSAADRARQAAQGLPIVQTSGYRTPAENERVGGSPTSYHLDKSNPATDWGGPTWALDVFAARLREMGNWRELLWRVPGHAPGDNKHVHVAHEGGMVTRAGIEPLRADEVVAKLREGETVRTREQEAALHQGGTVARGVGDTIVLQVDGRDLAEAVSDGQVRNIMLKTGRRD